MAKAQIIPPDSYPQMASKNEVARMSRALRAPKIIQQGNHAIEETGHGLREGVRDYVRALEAAAGDLRQIYEKAHDIRGFAETVGLTAAGRIADGLCGYLDETDRLAIAPDADVIAVHVSAIARAAYAEDEAIRMGDMVAMELAVLVDIKLSEARAAAGN